MSLAIARLRKAMRPLKRLIRRRPGPAILMYHRIAAEDFDPWGLAVSPEKFRAQMEWLARKRPVLSLDEFARAHRERWLPEEAVAITFDDGYACTFAVAAAILGGAKLPATVFLAPDYIDRGGEFWWDELGRIVVDTDTPALLIGEMRVELGAKSHLDRRWTPYDPPKTSRQKAYRRLWSALHPLRPAEVDAIMGDLNRQAGDNLPARETHRVATWEEIKATRSFDYGSHGLSHASLPALERADQAREIEDGRSALASRLGHSPRSFSYPFGDRSEAVRRIVAGAGFGCACASGDAFVRPGTDLFDLPRMAVGNCDAARLEQKLRGR